MTQKLGLIMELPGLGQLTKPDQSDANHYLTGEHTRQKKASRAEMLRGLKNPALTLSSVPWKGEKSQNQLQFCFLALDIKPEHSDP